MSDLIRRQDAVNALQTNCSWAIFNEYGQYTPDGDEIIRTLVDLPSAQPDLDEWCTDCKEYDSERHCCPRFNRVIREALKEVKKDDWVPCSERLPERDGEYLVTYEKGYAGDYGFDLVGIAPFEVDCEGFGIWQENFDLHTLGSLGSDWVDIPVIAWMPLPEPWEGENDAPVMVLPSAQPERKKGEWIENSPVTEKCDQCGYAIKDWDWHRFNYCPNCGGYNGFDGRPEWRPLIDVSSNDQK